MHTFDEVAEMLDDITEIIPAELLESLNGGIYLLPDSKHNNNIPSDHYWVLGEYCYSPVLGSKIYIYYGSFMALYIDADSAEIKSHLKHTLLHELRHHIERLAGYCDLELEDEQFVKNALKELDVKKDNKRRKNEIR